MNTQAQVLRIEAGQALPLPRRTGGPVVLTEGELVMQQPAQWLGGTVVLSAPVRIAAPATLPTGSPGEFIAASAATVVVPAAQPSVVLSSLRATAAWVRGLGVSPHAAS
ncbi:hypothetical protein H8N03_04835 [Ramlibacter sp. USB13]|uniref:Uncharacterized protein n=1 Tax=Ramlibacter cellulosilyticus TaxID=2764187 RepID=A0A923SA04_9BURK|nr:hypothetical protein [Ramlibacter cellulosilyticus]MBC5782259.1 hypothetical protein [Ramlibacter cellulosilyticus]